MKKKGFTLVELLAVIAILAILVIMALPAILRMYNSARKDSFTNEVNTIIRTARQQYLQDGGSTQTYSNVGSTNKLNLTGSSSLKYSVTMDKSGKITNLQATNGSFQYNKSGIIDVAEKDDVKAVSELSESELVLTGSNYGIMFVNRQVEGSITSGDEISIGGENFYVINTNSSTTEVFAKYNLYVGEMWDGDNHVKTLNASDAGYGLQNAAAIGCTHDDNSYWVGAVPFSGTNYWDNEECDWDEYDQNTCMGSRGLKSEYTVNGASYNGSPYPYVYRSDMSNIAPSINFDADIFHQHVANNGYTIAYYVERYINTLKSLGAPATITGRLLSYEEGKQISMIPAQYDVNVSQCNIGVKQLLMQEYEMDNQDATQFASALCSGQEVDGMTLGTCINFGVIPPEYYDAVGLSNVRKTVASQLANSTFWIGTADGSTSIFIGKNIGTINSYEYYNIKERGVRPVITIPTSAMPN